MRGVSPSIHVSFVVAVSTTLLSLAACNGGGEVACTSSRDCSAAGLVCDRALGRCVDCVTSADCLVAGEVCRASVCETVTRCVSSRECPGLVCDPARGYCVECVSDVDCPGGETCDAEGFCQTPPPPCVSDRMCTDLGLVCDDAAGECVECVRDADCGDGLTCVGRMCRVGGVDAGPPRDAGPPLGVDAGPPRDAGPPTGLDAGPITEDAGPPSCNPGSLVIVMDASGSMADSRYDVASNALLSWLATLPDAMRVGLIMQPGPADCAIAASPSVALGPLSSTRTAIAGVVSSVAPSGVGPLYAALDQAYDHVLTASASSPRAVLILADDGDFCTDRDAGVLTRVATMRAMGVPTYVVGLGAENNALSRIAIDGGDRISSTCVAMCAAGSCLNDDDCGGSTVCAMDVLPIPTGTCQCTATQLCPSPMTCGAPLFPNLCMGEANCCNRLARDAALGAELTSELIAIATDLIGTCP